MSSHQVKFESFDTSPANSIADSFASTPGTNYPPIFDDSPRMHPLDVFTPGSFDDEYDESIESTPAPEPDKRAPAKKRKSWGQQLPEPKTHLPPRKRAKTEDEKEQRRVERVLRNRRAAQTSRERKRLEVEDLEKKKQVVEQRNRDLERLLQESELEKQQLRQQLAAVTGGDMSVFRQASNMSNYNPNPEPLRERCTTPVTLSQELFGSRDSHRNMSSSSSSASQYSVQSSPQTVRTVNPSQLSPEPVDLSTISSSDMTQHPAAMLCDLQCQSEELSWIQFTGHHQDTSATAYLQMVLAVILSMTTAISMSLAPMAKVFHSLKTGSTLPPIPTILSTIIYLATTTTMTTPHSSTNSSTMTRSQGKCLRFGLRIRLLRRLLACSPQLARPLLDATLGAMRLVSKQELVNAGLNKGLAKSDSHRVEQSARLIILMTMAHAIRVIMKEQRHLRLAQTRPTSTRHDSSGELSEILGRNEISLGSGTGFGETRWCSSKALDGGQRGAF